MYLYEKLEMERKNQEKVDKFYTPNPSVQEKRYVSLMSGMSHTYGNALAYMQNWIIDLFPKNMFNTVHVNSKIAHRQIKSTPHTYLKKQTPMIIFRPRIPGRNEDKFLKGTSIIERQNDIYSTYGMTSLFDFFQDGDHDLVMKYQMNRTVMYVDVIITLSTLMKQLDYYHYIENAVRIDHPFALKTNFESYLPQEVLKMISDLSGVPVYDEIGSTKEFLDYMNGHSIFPITYKLDGGSKKKEFYRYYPVSIDTTITDLDKDDGEKTGQVTGQYQISFTVRMEFFSTGFYYLFSDKIYDLKVPMIDPSDSDLIPVFTDVFMREDLNLDHGWQVFNRASYRLEDEEDSVNIQEMFNASILETLKYHLKNGLPLFDFIDIRLRLQGKPIHEHKDYTIDWENLDIHFIGGDVYHTYSILICVNVEYVNNLMKTLYDLK